MLKSVIPVADIRFFEKMPRARNVDMRLSLFLEKLRASRKKGCLAEEPVEGQFDWLGDDLTDNDRTKITRRARLYVERLEALAGTVHLGRDDLALLAPLQADITVIRASSEHEADVLASTLHEEMPWMGPATEHVWHALRKSVREGQPGFQFAPLLLMAPPGIGKSHWARRLGQLLEIPTTFIEATGEPASFALIGSQRGWSTAQPGKMMQTVLRHKCAGPIIVVDEVEKVGDVQSNKGTRFTLADAMLPLSERSTAANWQCPYFWIRCDMSWVNWVLTANSLRGLSEPLLSRCPPLELPPLSGSHLIAFAQREAVRRQLPEAAVSAIQEIISMPRNAVGEFSLRTIKRMMDRAEVSANQPILH